MILSQEGATNKPGGEIAATVVSKPEVRIKEPSMYRVLLHNDDFTPMDFVVQILETVFNKNNTQATQIMLDVHRKGIGICGIYPYDIAETKVSIVTEAAREHEYPLRCTLEKS